MAQDPKDNVQFLDDGSVNIKTAGKLQYAGTAVTSTAAELNLLDGVSGLVQADLTKLAAIDATDVEIDAVCDASARLVNVTDATVTLSAATHGEKIVTLNRAGGVAVTLPAASGTGVKYTLYVGTTYTSDGTVKVANASDTMVGSLAVTTDIGGTVDIAGGTDDTITLNGSTTGGLVGSTIHLVDVASNVWLVSGAVCSSGTEATPFSATVS